MKKGNARRVSDLLLAGANPNAAVGKKGMTAMDRVKEPELEAILVSHGGTRADPDSTGTAKPDPSPDGGDTGDGDGCVPRGAADLGEATAGETDAFPDTAVAVTVTTDAVADDAFVELPAAWERGLSTHSINVEKHADGGPDVVVQGLRNDGKLSASNMTQLMVRERRSTRRGPKGQTQTAPALPEVTPDMVYDIVSKLGNGNFGEVSLVQQKGTTLQFAMKHIDLNRLGGAAINLLLSLREIELMKKMDHPHVIKLFEACRYRSSTPC